MLIATSSCNNDHYPTVTDRQVPIHFSMVSIGESTKYITRSTMGADSHNTGLPKGSDIDVFVYDKDGKVVPEFDDDATTAKLVTLPLVYTTTDDPNTEMAISNLNLKSSTINPPKYPTDNTKTAYIFAVYPAKATKEEATADSYTFEVEEDQTDAANVAKSDLLATEQITQSSDYGKAIDLPMTHCMAKVIIKFNPMDNGNLTESNMPTTFTLPNIKNSVTIQPKTAATGAEGSNGTAAISTNSSTTTITGSTEEALLIPPQKIEAGSVFLQFTIKGSSVDKFNDITNVLFKPSAEIDFRANTVYEITINVNVNYVTATATITDWNRETMTFDKYIL